MEQLDPGFTPLPMLETVPDWASEPAPAPRPRLGEGMFEEPEGCHTWEPNGDHNPFVDQY